ncbi:MAG TPA: hypothetical protein VIH61_03600, partial [Waddliaceae bacterium]
FLGILIAILVVLLGINYIPIIREKARDQQRKQEIEARDYTNAQELLEAGKPEEALAIIHTYKDEIEQLSQTGVQWMQLFVQASEQTKDVSQLVLLFEFFPEIFKEHEAASLLVANAYITTNQLKDYKKIRSLWSDREIKIAAWFILDVDQLLLEGRRAEAIELLKSRNFKDKADVSRLVRLALLYSNEDPKIAWKYLGEAYSKDPQSPDIRSYRAKLLESVGKNTLAHQEYQAASRLQPENLFLKEQLAEFYLRKRQYPLAVQTWKDSLKPPSLDTLWVKALFWNRVAIPITFDWERTAIPQGKLERLITYLINLEPGEFWNPGKFERLANGKFYLKSQQETFWLRLIQAFKQGNEKEAFGLLRYNPFHPIVWTPELELALKRILTYRKTGFFKVDEAPVPKLINESPQPNELPLFFKQLEELANLPGNEILKEKIPEDLHELLTSKEVFAIAFLVAGWTEAGLHLHSLAIIPSQFPGWVAPTVTQALRQNRTVVQALEFASLQKPTPELTLLEAEIMVAGGDTNAAIEKLHKLSKLDTDIGYRSAWLASLLYIERKDYDNARLTVFTQPRLINDLLGQETLARIAHLEGNGELADRLYTAIEKKSSEARSYLAKRAFAEKNWNKAKELTEQLIQDYPDNPMLKDNLQKILMEQRNAQNPQIDS